MIFNAVQIAAYIQGTIEGNEAATISHFSKIEDAKNDSLCFIANPKYEHYLYQTQAAVVIVNRSFLPEQAYTATLIRVDDAYVAFATLMDFYNKQISSLNQQVGVESQAFVHESATLSDNVYVAAFAYICAAVNIGENTKIHPHVFIGNQVKIGANTTIHAGVKIYNNCEIGNDVIIHAGAVIGADGFGFAFQNNGSYKKVPQLGNVIIEDDVEIGANTTIDRATMGATTIRRGVKLDNLIQIGHNVEIGEGTVIAAQTGISGSTKIGKNCVIGGQVGIIGHIKIADGTKINAQSGVSKAISKNDTAITGSPAFDYSKAMRSQAVFRNLPQLLERLEALEKKLK